MLQGKHDEAVRIIKELAQSMEPEHMCTQHILYDLSIALAEQGKLEEAEEVLIGVLEKCTQIIGESDPRTREMSKLLDQMVALETIITHGG